MPRQQTKRRKQFKTLEKEVHNRFGANLFENLRDSLRGYDLLLWSTDKPANLLDICLVHTLLHDMLNLGWKKIAREYDHPVRIAAKSMAHNARSIRAAARPWAESWITLGSLSEWTAAAELDNPPDWVRGPVLSMDSTDVRYQKYIGCSRKADCWSYKENGPALRFMATMDFGGRIRELDGGYSPKLYDGHWLMANKRRLVEDYRGAMVIANNHFYWGVKGLRPLNFHSPKAERDPKGTPHENSLTAHLTKDQKKRNAQIRRLRARVEHPFGKIKLRWKALQVPWKEGPDSLEDVVWMAIAWHNSRV
ncbi:hypothetical protein PROFUN_09461 [Planoprotostelium fungivorum]|uniref:DDE Tnp4 domain-containing protein n=1 Tax=Planoprotostelium fungivorum TaxID=1890364 RepID=A0A2P6NH28_9EUKA|nr:hypothetical protein PROFUN_09461 [Planoprotostelium fungivorum]